MEVERERTAARLIVGGDGLLEAEPGELGGFSMELVVERTRALGMQGRVVVSHAFCLGMPDAAYVARLVESLAEARVPVLATSSHADTSLFDADLSGSCAWLFGHEGQGVSETLLNLATQKITIPQQPGIESMNVAASAAVCLFEQVRQRRVGR
mgnify:CR=1 FL=1